MQTVFLEFRLLNIRTVLNCGCSFSLLCYICHMAKKRRLSGSSVAISVSLVLFVMGLFISLLYNADKLTTYLQENVLMILYFEGEVSETVLNERADSIASLDFVRSAKAITADEAAMEYREVIEKDFVDILGNNPLPASIEVQLVAGAINEGAGELIQRFSSIPGLDDVQFQEDLADDIEKNKKIAATVLLSLAILLLIVSLVLINNTIRLDVYARRFVVKSMQLVGATEWFIIRPFVVKALWLTAVSSVIAFCLVLLVNTGITRLIETQFFEVQHIFKPSTTMYLILFGLLVVTGLLIVLPSAYFATKKYLRLRIDDLY